MARRNWPDRVVASGRKETGLVFHSILLLFFFSSPLLSSRLSSHCCVCSLFSLPIGSFSSAFYFYFFSDPLFYFLLLSLVSISLTSLFVQAPVRVLRLGRGPRSSYFYLSSLRFSRCLSSWAQRLTAFPRATMSASGDDMPLAKSNGNAGGELLSQGPRPSPRSPHLRLFCALRSSEVSSCLLLHLSLFLSSSLAPVSCVDCF